MNNDLQSSDAKPADDDVNAAAVTSTADEPSVSPMELDFNIDDDDVFDISRVELDDDDNEQHNEEEEEEASGASIAQRYGFEIGDLVWGKVNSHPWWPGHIFNEAFETSHVRRTRPSGHVLVAFFGDSSFGWFNPAELVPFEPHFAEKSRHQSSFSNNLNNNKLSFTRAVEEAVDEANRRCGAAFVCRCRNADNFKESSSVPGYVIVDVPGYEKGAVYSTEMIRKAREGFDPIEIVSTVRELGKAPLGGGDRESLGFVRRRASVLAYRKAVFEEFDETYAEAFGATVADNQPVKPRAPLSGPLVIAESLSARKSATKPVKVKDNSKKDKYLFKRRDEASSSGGGALEGKKLKKRALPINMSQISTNSSAVSQGIKDEPSQSLKQEGEGPMQVNYEDSAKLSGLKGDNELNEVRVGPGVGDSVPIKKKSSAGKKVIGGVKKEKFLKRTRDDMNPAMSDMEDKQKKRKKIQLGSKAGFRDPQSIVTSGKISSLVGRDAGNANHADLPQEDFKEKKDVVLDNSLYESSGLLSILTEVELPQLVSDLQSLAIDPFHVSETNNHALVQQFFVQYRALVYQKSLIRSPPSEIEPLEGHIAKTSSGVKASQVSPLEPVPSLKSAKPLVRADDGTLLGRKRPPSDRQEEIAAKKSKKMSDRKLLAAERKVGVKIQETQHVEVYESAVPIPRRVKQGLVKKIEPPAKVVEPTMLVMKFPPADSLPSPAELKAKFARFGPTDQSALRVFYKSATCRIVFLYKSDAHAAFKFVSANKSFIGNLNVRLLLREVEAPASGKGYGDENSTETLRAKDSANSPTSALKQRQQQSLSHSALQPKSILKKSSGDDPRGQVTGGNGNSSKRTPRVKFMLGDEEPSRNKFNSASFADDDDDDGEPSSTTTSSVAMMNYNARNFQKLTPQSPLPPSTLPPLLALPNSRPLPSPYANPPPPPPHSNISQQHSDMLLPPPPSRNNPSLFKTQATFSSASSVDISQQMLSLLTRCNDVVTNVKSHLGYVPYHPL